MTGSELDRHSCLESKRTDEPDDQNRSPDDEERRTDNPSRKDRMWDKQALLAPHSVCELLCRRPAISGKVNACGADDSTAGHKQKEPERTIGSYPKGARYHSEQPANEDET